MTTPFVIHTTSAMDVFGPEKTVVNECLALRESGWESLIVNFWDEEDVPFARKVMAAGVSYLQIPSRAKFDFRAVETLRALLARRPEAIIHSHGYKADLYSLVAGRRARRGLVTTVHGWTSENLKVRLYERLQSLSWRFFDRVICVSQSYFDVALQRGVPAQKLVLIPNGIKANYVTETAAGIRLALRRELGLREQSVVIAIVGRLGPEKGHGLFVEAARRIREAGLDAEFLIVGEGAERAAIERQIAAAGLGDRVRLLGHRDDMARLYAAVDILAICSLREGLPNVLLEAMLHGIPAVSTAVGGIPEVVRDNLEGILARPGDTDGYCRALSALVADAPRRRALGDAARERVRSVYLFDRRMASVRALYETVGSAHGAAPGAA